MNRSISLELIAVDHYQVYVTLLTLMVSNGQTQGQPAMAIENLVCAIAVESMKGFEPCLTLHTSVSYSRINQCLISSHVLKSRIHSDVFP